MRQLTSNLYSLALTAKKNKKKTTASKHEAIFIFCNRILASITDIYPVLLHMGSHQIFLQILFLSTVRLGIPSSAKQLDHLSIIKRNRWRETSRYLKTSGYLILHPDVWLPLSAACYLWLNTSKKHLAKR